ncbi:uncharacterized protein [Chelonus insularis]|uniref:uncharacterized protein isoform X2 n=1 Tax=Chelonus insularis TaxID=460826 RepID=UPI00158EE700|nr:uncharacterized protein LOC118070108 isoform X2 [Chelonus insularis]
MDRRLICNQKFESFIKFEVTLIQYSKDNSVNFKKTKCRRICDDRKAQREFRPKLMYISSEYECEYKHSGCKAYIKLEATDYDRLTITTSELKHNHPYGPNAAIIHQTCVDLELFLINLPESKRIKTIYLLSEVLNEWRRRDHRKMIVTDAFSFTYRDSCMISGVVLNFGSYITNLRADRQLQRISDFKKFLERFSIGDKSSLTENQQHTRNDG